MQLRDVVLELPGLRLRSALLQAGCWMGWPSEVFPTWIVLWLYQTSTINKVVSDYFKTKNPAQVYQQRWDWTLVEKVEVHPEHHSLCSSSGCSVRPQLPCPHFPPLLKQQMVLACSYLAQELCRPWTGWTIMWQVSVWQIKVVRMRAQQGACPPSPSFPSDSNESTQPIRQHNSIC